MTQMTEDQLAKRAASKRNNRLRRSMPLFAPLLIEGGPMAGWLTTAAEQKERIQGQHAAFQEIWKRWEAADAEFKRRGDERRAIVAEHVDADTLAALDERYIRLLGRCGPEYWADFWWGKLVEYAPEAARARCPNRRLHEQFVGWHEHCPTCGLPLARQPSLRTGARQLELQEPPLA